VPLEKPSRDLAGPWSYGRAWCSRVNYGGVKLPVATWLHGYRREWLTGDVAGGLTAAAVVIPKVMAYGLIAGLTVEAGLYTALAAMLVYPLLGSSRILIVGTSSSLAMLMATAAATTSQTHGVEPAAVAGTLVLLVGAVMICGSVLKLGFLANFISLPVLIGFQAGVGIVIIVGQLKSLLGVQVESKTTLGTLLEIPTLLPQAHVLTVIVGAIALVTLVVLQRLFPRRPIPLVLLASSIAASLLFGLDALGVKTVGAFPPGLPSLTLPDLSLVTALWPAAVGVALMSFTESITAARASWQRGEPPVRANQELLALGAANSAVALVGGLPADGAVSHSAIARQAGARTQLAQWASAAAVIVTLLVLRRPIAALPEAALAAVVLFIAIGMVKLEPFNAIARVRRTELIWAIVTVAGVVVIGTLEGVVIAVVISVLTLVYQANRPPVYALAYNREQHVFRRAGENAADETMPGLLLLRVEGRLMFANAENVADRIRALVEQADPRVIVLECSGIPDIEYTALVALAEADERLRERGVALWLAGVNPDLLPVLVRSTLPVADDPSRVFANLHKALEAWERLEPTPGTTGQ
jgi:SulP family sulfate permease